VRTADTHRPAWNTLALLGIWLFLAFPFRPTIAAPAGLDISGLIQAAEHDFNSGNYPVAISTLESAVAQNAVSAEAHYWLGRSYYELRDFDNAVVHAEKSVALDARNSLYHQWLARAYGGKADRDKSFFLAKKVKKELEDAVRLNPSNIPARSDLEDFCLSAPWIVGGNKDEAHDQVDAISALDAVEGHLARASFDLQALKKTDAAESEYRQVLAARPSRVEPYLEVIAFFQKENQVADMSAAIEAAAQSNPKDPRITYFRAVALVLSGTEPAHAEEYLKSYIASTPERSDWPSHAAAREWLGRLYETQGKQAEAAEQYRASLQIDPSRKEARTQLEKLEKGPN
jgi:tetratricopeptide (TPR) repeat protein